MDFKDKEGAKKTKKHIGVLRERHAVKASDSLWKNALLGTTWTNGNTAGQPMAAQG